MLRRGVARVRLAAASHTALRGAGPRLARRPAAFRRLFSVKAAKSKDSPPVLITTPIFYVNGFPHIGHLYSGLLADALARWYRVLGQKAHFMTGTDEHGIKVQDAAKRAGKPYLEFCDAVSGEFRRLFAAAGIEYDDYLRTTQPRHAAAVERLWRTLHERGHIYLGRHEGWYCKSDEAFVPPTQLRLASVPKEQAPAAGVSDEDAHRTGLVREGSAAAAAALAASAAGSAGSAPAAAGDSSSVGGGGSGWLRRVTDVGHHVEWVSEENYKFRLSAFQQQIADWLTSNRGVVHPEIQYNDALSFVKRGLEDISVSRLRDKIEWALPVPGDASHSIYVWLDALTVYLTAAGYPDKPAGAPLWPATHQIVGKDILKFHAVYWPAFLLAAGLPLPKRLTAHAHWTVDNTKMSKSLGNVVDPFAVLDKFGVEATRYFLLKQGGIVDNGNFSEGEVIVKGNKELADCLGNLLARVTGKTVLPAQALPAVPDSALTAQDRELIAKLNALSASVSPRYLALDFASALRDIMLLLGDCNAYFDANKPWQLRTSDPARRDVVLGVCIEVLRVAGILLQPAVPTSTDKLLTCLGVPASQRSLGFAAFGKGPAAGTKITLPEGQSSIVLFRKYEPPAAASTATKPLQQRAASPKQAAAAAAAARKPKPGRDAGGNSRKAA